MSILFAISTFTMTKIENGILTYDCRKLLFLPEFPLTRLIKALAEIWWS